MKKTSQPFVVGALLRLPFGAICLSLGLASASAQSLSTAAQGGGSAASAAAPSGTGTIVGRVVDANSRYALPGVNVTVTGTPVAASTDQQGDYRLTDVPAGAQTVRFSFVGYPDQTETVTVQAGRTAELNTAFGQQVVKMDAFVTSSDIVGTARALNDQRTAASLLEEISSDAIGQLPDKDLAEALHRVPGVDLSLDKGEGRFVEIDGLDPVYVGISINGIRASTTEKGTREMPLDTIGSDIVSSMDVTKVNTPDMDADDMGASVNINTRTALDQQGTQAMLSVGGNYSHQEDRHDGYNLQGYWGDTFLNGKLGVMIDASAEFRPFTTFGDNETTPWSLVNSPTTGTPEWFLGGQDIRHYDVNRWRNSLAVSLDYKFDDTSKAWVRYFVSNYNERDHEWITEFNYGDGSPTALTDTSATVSIPAKDLYKAETENVNQKNDSSLVGGYEKIFGSWTDDLLTGYTIGKYTRPTVGAYFANTQADTVTYNFSSSWNDSIEQIAGPSINNPADYAFSTKSYFSQTQANMHEETVRDDLRDDFTVADNDPAFIKFGIEYRNKNNNENTFKEGLTSMPWTLANEIYSGDDIEDTAGNFPDFRILPQAVESFYTLQNSYGQSENLATTYGGAFQALEDIGAAYAEGGLTLGKLKILAGGRAENTHFWISGWQEETTKTGALLISPVAYDHNYANFLPDVILTYDFTPSTIGRASWSNTLARPDYDGVVPGRTVNDDTETVTQGNPMLDALQAMNWDASVEHYYSSLGMFAVRAFYKQIKNFSYQAQSGIDPSTGYLLTTYYNGPAAWIEGLELSWSQRFGFLPPPFDGLGVEANATVGDSQATYPTRPGEKLPFVGYAKKFGNVALTYEKRGLQLKAGIDFHGPRLEVDSSIGANYQQDEYEAAYWSLDVGASYRFAQHWEVYFDGANLNNEPLREYFGGTPAFNRIQTQEYYGWSGDGGLRWFF